MKRMVDKKEYVSPEDKFKGLYQTKEVNFFSGYFYMEYDGVAYDTAYIVQALQTPNITEQIEYSERSDIIQAASTMWYPEVTTVELYIGFGKDDNNNLVFLSIILDLSRDKLLIKINDTTETIDIDDEKLTVFSIELNDLSTGNYIFYEE